MATWTLPSPDASGALGVSIAVFSLSGAGGTVTAGLAQVRRAADALLLTLCSCSAASCTPRTEHGVIIVARAVLGVASSCSTPCRTFISQCGGDKQTKARWTSRWARARLRLRRSAARWAALPLQQRASRLLEPASAGRLARRGARRRQPDRHRPHALRPQRPLASSDGAGAAVLDPEAATPQRSCDGHDADGRAVLLVMTQLLITSPFAGIEAPDAVRAQGVRHELARRRHPLGLTRAAAPRVTTPPRRRRAACDDPRSLPPLDLGGSGVSIAPTACSPADRAYYPEVHVDRHPRCRSGCTLLVTAATPRCLARSSPRAMLSRATVCMAAACFAMASSTAVPFVGALFAYFSAFAVSQTGSSVRSTIG